jgi:uncharacterized cupredoxin-like copper-binding protein
MSLRLPARVGACALGVSLTLGLAACGHSRGAHGTGTRTVVVTERDFAIKAPHRLRPGAVHFVIDNHGPVSHELILVRAPDGQLPMRSDGLTLDEEALQSSLVGVLEPDGPGSSRVLDVHLAPGHYVFFCNMAGHYMSGMSSSLTVA